MQDTSARGVPASIPRKFRKSSLFTPSRSRLFAQVWISRASVLMSYPREMTVDLCKQRMRLSRSGELTFALLRHRRFPLPVARRAGRMGPLSPPIRNAAPSAPGTVSMG